MKRANGIVLFSYFIDMDAKLQTHEINVLRTKIWKVVDLGFEISAFKLRTSFLKAPGFQGKGFCDPD